jgi:DNA gyrase subunit A
MRLIIELKRDAVAQVVLNQLYKHTQLQDNFGANMLALVDGVPRTLTLEQFIRHWISHQIEVIQRRTRYRLRKAEERAHILRGYLKALDALDDVIALIRASATVEDARAGLMELLEIDEVQATAILDMQLRRLAALERQKIIDEYDELMARIADYNDILASEVRQRSIVSEELAEVTEKFGDERRTQFAPWDGDMSDEDLIAEDDVVVTITSGGYAKRTKLDLYRSQRRGGKGVRGAALRQDDVVEHMFVTTTHHWILFFTNKGRVYRAKAYQLPDSGRDARGQHVANLLAFQPDEEIAQVLAMPDFESSDYLVMATRKGLVKKTKLSEYDKNRQGGIIAINLTDDDELIAARQVSESDDLLLVSRKGMSARFTADDETLRPMGRATSGVIGMRFRDDDSLLAMDVVQADAYVVTITDGGFAKRTPVGEWAPKGRGILGVRAMKLVEERGSLVGAMVCQENDELFAIASNGIVIRTRVGEVRPSGRDTMGVTLMNLADGDSIVAVARGGESADDDEGDDDSTEADLGVVVGEADVATATSVDGAEAELADPGTTE